jgi:hypothetical protein
VLIQACIGELARLAELLHLDKKYKEKYHKHFPTDIPHIKDLPHNVYHNIELLLGSPISVAQAYGCLRKYWPTWKTLIDQHLATGRIQPLSSESLCITVFHHSKSGYNSFAKMG